MEGEVVRICSFERLGKIRAKRIAPTFLSWADCQDERLLSNIGYRRMALVVQITEDKVYRKANYILNLKPLISTD
jgi:hypothetical protein